MNFAECLTRLVIKNHVPVIEQYLKKLDRKGPMDLNIIVPFASLQRPLLQCQNLLEVAVASKHIIKKPEDHEHLSIHSMAGDIERLCYAGYPFYTLIFHSDWATSEKHLASLIHWRTIAMSCVGPETCRVMVSATTYAPDLSSIQWRLAPIRNHHSCGGYHQQAYSKGGIPKSRSLQCGYQVVPTCNEESTMRRIG